MYPPIIPKVATGHLGQRIRGIRIIEPSPVSEISPGYDTDPYTGLWHYCAFENFQFLDLTGNERHWTAVLGFPAGSIQIQDQTLAKNGNAMWFSEVTTDTAGGGKIIQGPTHAADWEFDGSAGTLESFTIRFWFKVAALPTGALQAHLLDALASNNGWAINLTTAGLLWIVKDSGGTATTATISSAGINLGKWNYFVAYHNNGVGIGARLNDGSFVTEAHATGIGQTDSEVHIGYNLGDVPLSDTIAFSMDELAVWSRVLSANDVDYDYNDGAGRFFGNLKYFHGH